MSPEDFAAARYEALNERIVDMKAGVDRRFANVHGRIDRLDEEKAERVDVDRLSSVVDKMVFAIVGFSLTVAGSAAIYALQANGG